MLKRSLLFAGIAGASLLAAAEPAPNAQNAQNANAPVVTEEETITVVAVPCPSGSGDCAQPRNCTDKKDCKDQKKCKDKKDCANKKACAAPAAANYSDGDYDLAFALMEAGGVPAEIDDANNFLIIEQMAQTPMLKPAQPAFEKFFQDHCSYHAMKRDLAKMHLATFTRDEMRKIIDFFHTPEGKKYAANQAALRHNSMALRADRIHRNLPELQQNVHACMTKAQQDNANASACAAPGNENK